MKWFNDDRGFGFIIPESGAEIFVHWHDIEGRGRRVLDEGQEVEFTIGHAENGKTYAGGVVVIRPKE